MTPAEEMELRALLRLAHRRETFRQAGCEGKEAFASPPLARRSSLFRRAHRSALAIYHCRYCGLYHIGTRGGGR